MRRAFVNTFGLLLAAIVLAGAPQLAAGAYFYDWDNLPSTSIDDPVPDVPPTSTPGQDITKAWYASDGTYDYFRMDLLGAPNLNDVGQTYGIYLDTTAGGAPAGDPRLPEDLRGIDFILSSTFEVFKWDAEFERWTRCDTFQESGDLKFQAVMNEGTTLEWKVRDTSGGVKYFGDSFTWWAATMLVGGENGDPPSITYDLTNPVPIPNAVWLFGTGLVALIGLKRRKTAAA